MRRYPGETSFKRSWQEGVRDFGYIQGLFEPVKEGWWVMARLFTDEEIKERQNAVTSSANKKFFTDAEIAERSKTYKYQLPEQQKPVNRIELDKAGKPVLPKFEEKTIFDVLDEREAKKQEEQAAFAKRATENHGPGKSILYGVGSGMNRVATGLEQLHQLAQGNTNPVRQNVRTILDKRLAKAIPA